MLTQIDDPTAAQQNLVNAHFEEVASEWAEIYERQGLREFVFQERLRIVLDMVRRLDLPSRTRVLEIGSGAGFGALGLAKMGYAVDAVDPVQAMVEATRKRAGRAGLDQYVRSSLGDVHALGFPNEAFDLVLALGVLPWLPSLEQPLREMCRVLRQRGYLIVTADNSWGLRNFLEPLTNPIFRSTKELARRLLRGSRQRRARGHRISLRQCDVLLETSGLEKMESVTLGFGPFTLFNRQLFPPPLGLRVHHRLQALANSGLPVLRSSGSEYIVLAKKRGTTMHRAIIEQAE
jgi:ubiquinone/menaquinone biosynthesis C-methylase UbiE